MSIRLLHIEDEAPFVEMVAELLRSNGMQVDVTVAPTLEAAKTALTSGQSFDVIVLDLNLPDSRSFETLERIKEISNVPIIVASGVQDEQAAIKAFRLGASEFVFKSTLTNAAVGRRLVATICAEVFMRDADTMSIVSELRRSTERLYTRLVANTSNLAIQTPR